MSSVQTETSADEGWQSAMKSQGTRFHGLFQAETAGLGLSSLLGRRMTPLRCASDLDNFDAFEYLLSCERTELFASSGDVLGIDAWTICRQNNKKFLQALIRHPSFLVEQTDEEGRTLLQRSLWEAEKYLVEYPLSLTQHYDDFSSVTYRTRSEFSLRPGWI